MFSPVHSLLEAGQGTFWFPPSSSAVSDDVDMVFKLIFWICTGFFIIIMAVLIMFLIKYRHREGHKAEKSSTHSMPLEITWSLLPATLLAVIFVFATEVYFDVVTPPPGKAHEIHVKAAKWSWSFTYENGHETYGELHIPKGEPVRLIMRADTGDVIHSLFVPAFRVKKDIIPGRYSKVWFEATESTWQKPMGTEEEKAAIEAANFRNAFDLFCTEYCGKDHSNMIARVHVHDGDYYEWLGSQAPGSPLELGEKIYNGVCKTCHSIEPGQVITGPSFYDLSVNLVAGNERPVVGGSRLVDHAYIAESIRDPNAEIAAGGFKTPSEMAAYSDYDENKIIGLVAYIRSLTEKPEEGASE